MKLGAILLLALGWFPTYRAQAGAMRITLLPESTRDSFFLARLRPMSGQPALHLQAAHVLSSTEIAAAIQLALTQKGSALARQVSGERMQLESVVIVPDANPGLLLTGITYDRALHSVRFRLRPNAFPKAPPFYAWCAMKNWNDAPRGTEGVATPSTEKDGPQVSPRRMACLHLHSKNYFAVLQVRPLQAGNDGDTVRVRLAGNGQTLRATIVGKDRLDASF